MDTIGRPVDNRVRVKTPAEVSRRPSVMCTVVNGLNSGRSLSRSAASETPQSVRSLALAHVVAEDPGTTRDSSKTSNKLQGIEVQSRTTAATMAGTAMDAWLQKPNQAKKRKSEDGLEQQPSVKRTKSESDNKDKDKDNAKPRPQKSATANSDLKKLESPENTLTVTEEEGDIFDAPPNTLIIHACNCDGSWGGGIALAFKNHYPVAYRKYAAHCKATGGDLVGTGFLIPPQAGDDSNHFVGCLFTSRHYGRQKDSPTKILAATKPAMLNLLKQIKKFNAKADKDDRVNEVRVCKINSGLFKVPWAKTRAVLEGIDVSGEDVKEVKVVSPEE
ncbi:ADP-ribose 1''-phosphate phosphatase [Elasticomyces elasticus]|nr:ADP-ribose 1''-phosphate phosphatase [Elasticomyces elasticus]